MVSGNSKPSQKELTIEVGVDSSLPFQAPYDGGKTGTRKLAPGEKYELYHGDDADYFGPSIPQLTTMRKQDGQARALYRLLTLPVRSAIPSSTIIPAEGGEKEAKFIEDVFFTPPESGGMKITFHRFLSQVLMGLFDGFSAFEKIFQVPKEGPLKGKITLKKLAYRPSETVTFLTDADGGFAGIRQQTFFANKTIDVAIPKEYVFYYAAQEEERRFYGISYFQSAFYHYDKKVRLYWLAHLAAQRAAVGTRVAYIPASANTKEVASARSAIADVTAAQWMLLPEKIKVEILKESGGFDFLGYINHHNSQMSKSILATFFDKEQGAGKNEGTWVQFGAPGNDMFVLMLRAIMDEIAEQINHYIIPQLVDLNFKSKKYPKFTWGQLTDAQREAIGSAFDRLSVAGQSATVTPEFLRELEKHMAEEFGFDIDWDEVEKAEEEEAAMLGAFDSTGDPMSDLEAPVGNEEDISLEEFSNAVDELSLSAEPISEEESRILGIIYDMYKEDDNG